MSSGLRQSDNMYRYERHFGSLFLPQSNNFREAFDKWVNTENLYYWNTMAGNNSSTDVSLSMYKIKIKSNHMVLRGPRSEEFSDCAITMITYRVSTQPAVGAAKHHRQNASLTALFGHYIGGSLGTKIRLQSQIDFTTKHQYQHEWMDQQVGTLLKRHTVVPSPTPPQPPWHEIKGAGETV